MEQPKLETIIHTDIDEDINNPEINMFDYFNYKLQQKTNNNYNPDNNNIKYLLIFASHCDSDIKFETIKNNLKYMNYKSIDIVFINTINLPFNKKIKYLCKTYNNIIKQYEITNMKTYDFGKWTHCLKSTYYSKYDFVIFTNDSFFIHEPIDYFFNLTYKYNVELFGYNDSTQRKYHYQSYLFAIRKDAVPIFLKNYNLKQKQISNQEDVVTYYELEMFHWFKTADCFLSIGHIPKHQTLNIFFTNDKLYEYLKELKLLPFTKIKRFLLDNPNSTINT